MHLHYETSRCKRSIPFFPPWISVICSAESSTLSFNIINRSGHDFMGPLTANGHVREVFDSEEASTSELRNVDSSEQHASPHSDASSVSTQNGINLKVVIANLGVISRLDVEFLDPFVPIT